MNKLMYRLNKQVELSVGILSSQTDTFLFDFRSFIGVSQKLTVIK